MQRSVPERIRGVVADVFGVKVDSLVDGSSPDTIPEWDSLGHINLVLALESEFDVSLGPEDALDMLSVGLIGRVLAEKGVV
jgi:acyl carrier protein